MATCQCSTMVTSTKQRMQKRIIEVKKAMEEGDTKCFVVMASKAGLNQRQDARVQVLMVHGKDFAGTSQGTH